MYNLKDECGSLNSFIEDDKMYPINLKLDNRKCAVVGGGQVACRKIGRLLENHALITVISPEADDEIQQWAGDKRLTWKKETYSKNLLEGFFCVFCATDNLEVNRQAAMDAKDLGILVNVASQPELCDFTVPGVVKQGRLQFTVSSEGASPAYTRLLRQDLEKRYHQGFGEMADFIEELRQELIGERSGYRAATSKQRQKIWRQALTPKIIDLIYNHDLDRAKHEIRNAINSAGS
ncbi:bifunctional precorrin-2 dehydrogenase/sirohydrochlorin ferrochelatase [Anaerovibrio sp. RM50]|uniref:precorrin-2 dehydrogenase/sirohydrochlorin ferrochelatase family protein n=1 Tax=Anaerovibrio sp. RM50 TaxID=1200557 RepID=UPI0018DC7F8C|nr:bifunctional precorrin-2 dehydrogenase/sirohydrochlorin ferrochelatase [Anaerovibrio sp. RM50]